VTVYFISRKDSKESPVKIGVTADLGARLSGLQTSHHEELEIVAEVEGGPETEAYFHEILSAHRIRGEWFRRTHEVDAVIDRVRRSGASALPLSDPGLPDRRFIPNQDVKVAQQVSRYIAARLYPVEPLKFVLPGIARRLRRYCPSMREGRFKALLYGEARRVDHFEMRALIALRDEVNRIDSARAHLAAIPTIVAHMRAAGAPFDDRQLKVVDQFVERCLREADEPAGDA